MTRMEPYVINLGPEVGEIEWHSISDSIKWLAGLEDEWSWLNQRPISLIGNVHPWAQLVSHLNSIKQSLDRAMALQSQANNDGAASNFDSAYAELKELFENQPWLAPHSSRHALIKDVRERKGDRVAGILLALWMKLPISREIDQAAVAQACIEAELFDRGAPPRSEWDSKAYTEILKTLTADRSSYLAALKDA